MKGSSNRKTASATVIVGAMYWKMPIAVSVSRRAALANQSRGNEVATPAPTSRACVRGEPVPSAPPVGSSSSTKPRAKGASTVASIQSRGIGRTSVSFWISP